MGKKYIIELEEKPMCIFDEDTQTYFPRLHRVKGFNSLVFDQNGLDKLTPYTEPDLKEESDRAYAHGYTDAESEYRAKLDEIREEAYQKGLNDSAKVQNIATDAAYQCGLNAAWEAARKLVLDTNHGGLTNFDIEKIFGYDEILVIQNYSASEAIEKIRQYEQKHEENKIKVGDEIEYSNGIKALVLDVNDEHLSVLNDRGYTNLSHWKGSVKKTGRCYPEIAEVLRKMGKE